MKTKSIYWSKTVSCLCAEDENFKSCFHLVVVAKDKRRRGLGTLLMKEIEKFASKYVAFWIFFFFFFFLYVFWRLCRHFFDHLVLSTTNQIDFYQRNGFVINEDQSIRFTAMSSNASKLDKQQRRNLLHCLGHKKSVGDQREANVDGEKGTSEASDQLTDSTHAPPAPPMPKMKKKKESKDHLRETWMHKILHD